MMATDDMIDLRDHVHPGDPHPEQVIDWCRSHGGNLSDRTMAHAAARYVTAAMDVTRRLMVLEQTLSDLCSAVTVQRRYRLALEAIEALGDDCSAAIARNALEGR